MKSLINYTLEKVISDSKKMIKELRVNGEFDPGSERTLAAGLTHASRTKSSDLVADG